MNRSVKMKPLGYREIWKESNSADKMPKKTVRKWKRKARQKAKKEIKNEMRKLE